MYTPLQMLLDCNSLSLSQTLALLSNCNQQHLEGHTFLMPDPHSALDLSKHLVSNYLVEIHTRTHTSKLGQSCYLRVEMGGRKEAKERTACQRLPRDYMADDEIQP